MVFKDKETAHSWFRKRALEKRKFLASLKDVPCTDCKGRFPHYVMEFDHVPERGEKLFAISDGGGRSTDSQLFLDELKKCDIVCANCHTIRTFKRSGKDELE